MSIEQVKKELAEYKDLLTFERGLHPDKGEVTLIRTKQFLQGEKGKETWSRINSIIKGLGGEWVSAGKESHWCVQVEAAKTSESYATIRCPYCNKPINFTVGAPK